MQFKLWKNTFNKWILTAKAFNRGIRIYRNTSGIFYFSYWSSSAMAELNIFGLIFATSNYSDPYWKVD